MNILIIDDEPNIRNTLCSIMRDEGYTCEVAENGIEGIARLDRFDPDVILLDVQMDGMDGLEALEKILHYDKTIEVIMISGHSGISEAVRAIKLGAFDFLEKPLSLPKVKLAVKKALEFGSINREYRRIKSNLEEGYRLVGESEGMLKLREIIRKVSGSNSKVLIQGESGTGKELVAYAVHSQSRRSDKPFIKFNSAAIPTELVESELFGYEKGAFTGAIKTKRGKLEEADGGTIFLDEIGDMSLSAQAKILRVMQEGEFERVGSTSTRKIDARIIAATHKDLNQMVKEGHFREDLFYRLNVVPVFCPPLRERSGDIPILIRHFSHFFAQELNIPEKEFDTKTVNELKTWRFPGNVRELRNLIERIYILVEDQTIMPEKLPVEGSEKADCDTNFWLETGAFNDKKKEFEVRYLKTQLTKFDNHVSNTAKALSLHQSNLSRKLKELDIFLDEE